MRGFDKTASVMELSGGKMFLFCVEGRPPHSDIDVAVTRIISPDYFRVMGISERRIVTRVASSTRSPTRPT